MLQIAAAVSFLHCKEEKQWGVNEILVLLILFGANLLQAITGFAGTLISMPPTMKLIGVDEAKALLNAIAQISSH